MLPFTPRTYKVGDKIVFRDRTTNTDRVGEVYSIDTSCGYVYQVKTAESRRTLFNYNIEGLESELRPSTTPSSNMATSATPGPSSSTSIEKTTSRFQMFNPAELQNFKEQHENKRTVKKTISHVKLVQDFLKEVNENRPIHTIPPCELDPLLCQFFVGLRKENGDEYEPGYLRNVQGSLERHLRARNYQSSITRGFEFHNSREMLISKQKDLRKQGKGNGPKTARAINDEEVEILHETGQMGIKDAQSILNFLWWTNTTRFGMRGVTEHHNLRWGDITIGNCPVRGEYIQYQTERQTKSRIGIDPKNVRDLHPKAFATGDERCPVNLMKIYTAQRPSDFCSPDSPFYLAKKVNPKPDQLWFQRQPLGENSISKIMRNMTAAAGISDTKLTNTSARKHLLQKLNDCGVPPTHIMQISGHKNVQSVNRYSKLSDNQQLAISNIMSNPDTNPNTYLPLCQSDSSVSVQRITKSATSIEQNTDTFQPQNLIPGNFNFLQGATITGNVQMHIHVNNPDQHKSPEAKRTKFLATESHEVVRANISTSGTSDS